MNKQSRVLMGLIAAASAVVALSATSVMEPEGQAVQRGSTVTPMMPMYDAAGALQLPQDWRRWVFVGASLGLSYAQGGPVTPGMEMFHETLMEPTAYQHFVDTGTFREGTMFVLVLHGTGESVLPARRGRFAAEMHGVEMAVKDSSRRPEGWAYYNFGGMSGIRNTAPAMPKESCYSCHIQHARRDNVFMQFYPLLEDVAPRPAAAHAPAANLAVAREGHGTESQQSAAKSALALRGLDPVLLAAGQEEMGKPEIVAVHNGLRYQFVSEPHRVRFESDAKAFVIQNDVCPVVDVVTRPVTLPSRSRIPPSSLAAIFSGIDTSRTTWTRFLRCCRAKCARSWTMFGGNYFEVALRAWERELAA